MAGSKVSNFAIGDSDIQGVMLTLDKTFKGQHQVSLTNYDTTAESQVAAGSVIEIGGALYNFDSNESITGTPSDGTVYIMAVPSGDIVTCAYTNTAPTWSDSKQGWYGTGGTANNRYVSGVTKSGSLWKCKFLFLDKNSNNTYISLSRSPISGASTGEITIEFVSDIDKAKEWNNSTYTFTPNKTGIYNIKFRAGVTSGGTVVMALSARIEARPLNLIMGYNPVSGSTVASSVDLFIEKGEVLKFTVSLVASSTATISALSASIHQIM